MSTKKSIRRNVSVDSYYYFSRPTYDTSHSCSDNSHRYTEINVVLSGSLQLTVEGEVIILQKNQMYMIPPHTIHSNKVLSNDTKMVVCGFNTNTILEPKIYSLTNVAVSIIKMMIGELSYLGFESSKFQFSNYDVSQSLGNLTELLILECLKLKDATDKPELADLFNKIGRYMHENMGTPMTVKSIADTFHISETTLKNIFKKQANSSVIAYYNDLRLDMARAMLLDGESITIVETLGYCSQPYFTLAFKKKYGIPPSKFLK